ncbi:MAG TPA: ABC transporter substrate-binding protein [Streptosporangiaceae bacterium]|nr:ABC transporter substrate-binding protein [Streptosporangiaceae bacterium]
MSRRTRGALAGIAVIAGLSLAACGSGGSSNPLKSSAPPASKGSVVVGSANFPEDELLAEIYAQALQAKGIKVTTRFNIGAREVYYPQVVSGAVTILPEYNGALLTTSLDPNSTAATTAQVNAELTTKLPSSVEILSSSSAQDKDSVTVTQATAAKYHLASIADLKPFASKMIIGGPPEFKTRRDGLLGLKSVYGLTFKGFDPLDESGPITLSALTSGKVQAADVFTTTPQIITDHLVALADPKFDFAAQNVTPLVYKKGVNPTIVSTLNEISAKLTTAGLLAMDKQIILNKASYPTVASNWLKSVGLG